MIAAAFAHYLDSLADARLVWDVDGATSTIFVDWMPDAPTQAVAIMSQPGGSNLDKLAGRDAAIQCIVRGSTNRGAYDLAEFISEQLDCLAHYTVGVGTDDELTVIGSTLQQSAPVPMGRDTQGRSEYSLNIAARIHNPTSHRPGA